MCHLCASMPPAGGTSGSGTGDGSLGESDEGVLVDSIDASSGGDGTIIAGNTTGKPSLTTDEAAAQIARWGIKWGGDGTSIFEPVDFGVGATVTYGYLTAAGVNSFDESNENSIAMSAAEQAAVENAIATIEAVANINFVYVGEINSTDGADIAIMGESFTNGGVAYVSSRNNFIEESVVVIGTRGLTNEDSYAYSTAIHELLHALGLAHPGDYDASDGSFTYEQEAEYYEDTRQYSLMSYFDESITGANHDSFAETPLLHDIAAIQDLYGANTTTYQGDTTYGVDSNTGERAWTIESPNENVVGSIWDAGGTDTIDVSIYSDHQMINLAEDTFSSIGDDIFNISIAQDVKIENAIGGSGNDTIYGNDPDADHIDAMYWNADGTVSVDAPQGFDGANHLVGGGGRDEIYGLGGDDTLEGGAGDDTLDGGAGNDTIIGGEGSDLIIGGDGNNVLIAGDLSDWEAFLAA